MNWAYSTLYIYSIAKCITVLHLRMGDSPNIITNEYSGADMYIEPDEASILNVNTKDNCGE